MRRSFLPVAIIISVFIVSGSSKATSSHQYLPVQVGWSLSQIASNYNVPLKSLSIERIGQKQSMGVKFPGKLFERMGEYVIAFNDDTLAIGGMWRSSVQSNEESASVFKSIQDEFAKHDYRPYDDKLTKSLFSALMPEVEIAMFLRDSAAYHVLAVTDSDVLVQTIPLRLPKETSVKTGFSQADTSGPLPAFKWSLSRVATFLGLDKDALVLHKLVPDTTPKSYIFTHHNPTTINLNGERRLFGREGLYSIGFNKDTLLTKTHWMLLIPQGENAYEVFNALRDSFYRYDYTFKTGTELWPASPSDESRSIAFIKGDTRYVLSYFGTFIDVSSFVNAQLQTGIEYEPPTQGWSLLEAAKHYGQEKDKLVLDSVLISLNPSLNPVFSVRFVGPFCKQNGMYDIQFNKDTLLTEYFWISSPTSPPYQLYNTIIQHLQSNGFQATNEAELFATSSDKRKHASLSFLSTTVLLYLEESIVFATTSDIDSLEEFID